MNIGILVIPIDGLHHFSEGWPKTTKQNLLYLADSKGWSVRVRRGKHPAIPPLVLTLAGERNGGWFDSHGGTPLAGWFIRKNPIKMDDDWGYPYFRKPPNVEVSLAELPPKMSEFVKISRNSLMRNHGIWGLQWLT